MTSGMGSSVGCTYPIILYVLFIGIHNHRVTGILTWFFVYFSGAKCVLELS